MRNLDKQKLQSNWRRVSTTMKHPQLFILTTKMASKPFTNALECLRMKMRKVGNREEEELRALI